MKKNFNLASRLLLTIGIAVILAGLLSQLFGVKTSSSWGEEEFLGKNEYLALMVWSVSSNGKLTVKTSNTRYILYAIVKGNPLSLVMNSTAFGVKIKKTETMHDFRAGVFYASAKVSMDPFALAFLASRFKKENRSTLSLQLDPSESVIFVLIPLKTNSVVSFNTKFKVIGYEKMNFTQSLGVGFSFIVAALLLPYIKTGEHRVSN